MKIIKKSKKIKLIHKQLSRKELPKEQKRQLKEQLKRIKEKVDMGRSIIYDNSGKPIERIKASRR